MNYSAPSRRYTPVQRQPPMFERITTVIERIQIIYSALQHLFGLFVGFPLFLLEKVFGIDVVEKVFSCCSPLCSLCTCAALLGITSSMGIALGVGLGVGLNCADTQYFPRSNGTTTNSSGFWAIFLFLLVIQKQILYGSRIRVENISFWTTNSESNTQSNRKTCDRESCSDGDAQTDATTNCMISNQVLNIVHSFFDNRHWKWEGIFHESIESFYLLEKYIPLAWLSTSTGINIHFNRKDNRCSYRL